MMLLLIMLVRIDIEVFILISLLLLVSFLGLSMDGSIEYFIGLNSVDCRLV